MKKLLLSAFVVCLLFGCQDDDSQPADTNTDPVAVDFTLVEKTYFSGDAIDAGNFVINTQAEWDAFVAMANSIYDNEWQPLAGIEPDFVDYTYLVALDEWHSNGGYDITIVSVIEEDGGITVDVEDYGPDGGNATAVLTQPYHIVKIDKTNLSVAFE